eukprot:TRINITY_DN12601_c0_g1_i1.p1 TRINITY_DN12601_c0_g1~~TRINITY_DN12601_c0_g1_i1.p1  ORF type:complete len:114 (+),score=11.78 TRINITY_DN12601_c0_g1_i1:623-964(+)
MELQGFLFLGKLSLGIIVLHNGLFAINLQQGKNFFKLLQFLILFSNNSIFLSNPFLCFSFYESNPIFQLFNPLVIISHTRFISNSLLFNSLISCLASLYLVLTELYLLSRRLA